MSTVPEKGEGFQGQRIIVLPRHVAILARKHPLLRGLLPTDVGTFPRAVGHVREREQGAEQAIFIYCVKGGGWCETGGRRHEVHPGELLVLPPGAPHLYGAEPSEPWTIHWFHAQGDHVKPFLAELGVTEERPVVYLGEDVGMLALFGEIIETLEHGYAPVQLLYASQVAAHLLAAMVRRRNQNWREEPGVEQKITRTIDYMKQHLDQQLRLGSLAALANLSVSHYTVLFKKQTGYTPLDYFIRLRMHQAAQMLDTTNLSVKKIGLVLGYPDPLYFSRLFRGVNGMSPSEYRRLHKG